MPTPPPTKARPTRRAPGWLTPVFRATNWGPTRTETNFQSNACKASTGPWARMRARWVSAAPFKEYSLGQQILEKVLRHVFWSFHRQLGLTAAAMLPKQARGTSRKHVTKHFTQPAAPDCRNLLRTLMRVLLNHAAASCPANQLPSVPNFAYRRRTLPQARNGK